MEHQPRPAKSYLGCGYGTGYLNGTVVYRNSQILYHMLHKPLKEKEVGLDIDILRANCLLIMPMCPYHLITNSHHRFRKHENFVGSMEATRPEEI